MGHMFEQAPLTIENPAVFEPVRAAVAASFAPPSVEKFLKQVKSAKLRVRDFETIRERGLLGDAVKSGYIQLGNSDQGQVRELYLGSVERVALELRNKYLKLYAYY